MTDLVVKKTSPDCSVRKTLLILSIIFLLLSGGKILLSGNIIGPQIFEDELAYDSIAKSIFTGDLLAGSHPYPPGPFPPGYSFFISFAYFLASDKYVAYHYMLIINALITSSIIFPAYFILNTYTSRQVAFSGAVLVTLLPSVTMNSFVLMSEALFIPLFLFSIWFVQRSLSDMRFCIWDPLLGITLFLLFFTRTPGVSMAAGLIITFAWLFCRTESAYDRKTSIKKIAGIIIPGLFLYLAWVLDQIATKGTLPSGYSPLVYISQFIRVLSHDPLHIGYVTLLHADYILLSSFIIFPFLVYTLFRIAIPCCRENDQNVGTMNSRKAVFRNLSPVVMYTGISAVFLFLFGISHMIQPLFEYKLCGRYVDPIVPVIVMAGIIGLYRIIPHSQYRVFAKEYLAYLIITVILTGIIMLPFPHEPNNNMGIFYLYSFTSDYFVPLISLMIGMILGAVVMGGIIARRGTVLIILLFGVIIAISSAPIFFAISETSAKTGSLLPLCQDVNTLCGDSGKIYWDRAALEENVWDMMVYYTLKFWLGSKIISYDSKNTSPESGKNYWVVTRDKVDNPALSYNKFSIIPVN